MPEEQPGRVDGHQVGAGRSAAPPVGDAGRRGSSGAGSQAEPVVVRVEIAVSSLDGVPVAVQAASAPRNQDPGERDSGDRVAELEARAVRLASEASTLEAREAELERRSERLMETEREVARHAAEALAGRAQAEGEGARREQVLADQIADLKGELEDHQAQAARLEDLSFDLAEREAELARARRPNTKRVAEAEAQLLERLQEVDDREGALDVREAEREADFELREERLEHREHDLAQLEERLRRKERELAGYVGQLQDELVRREAEWWQKLAGGNSIRH